MFRFENLMFTYVNEDGTYDLEFQAEGRTEFIRNISAEGADTDEFYFDDEETVNKIIDEYNKQQ